MGIEWNEDAVFHSMTADQAEAWARAEGDYRGPGLDEEGFIHLAKLSQLPWVKERFYKNVDDLYIMVVDPGRLSSRLVYEGPAASPELVRELSGDTRFPHIYGPVNREAIVGVVPYGRVYVEWLIRRFRFSRLPVEGTFYKSTYRGETKDGLPQGTAMLGMYSTEPESVSCFHRLTRPELWHFYGGDPLELILLHEDGRDESVVLGPRFFEGQEPQYLIPAGVWQAGRVARGGSYSLFGCTLAPGFTPDCFEAGLKDELVARYPSRRADIEELSVNGDETTMPDDLDQEAPRS